MAQLDPLRAQQIAVTAFRTRAEADMAVTMLATYGISASTSLGHVDVAFPSLSFVQGHRVVVESDRAEEAAALLGVDPPPTDPPPPDPPTPEREV